VERRSCHIPLKEQRSSEEYSHWQRNRFPSAQNWQSAPSHPSARPGAGFRIDSPSLLCTAACWRLALRASASGASAIDGIRPLGSMNVIGEMSFHLSLCSPLVFLYIEGDTRGSGGAHQNGYHLINPMETMNIQMNGCSCWDIHICECIYCFVVLRCSSN